MDTMPHLPPVSPPPPPQRITPLDIETFLTSRIPGLSEEDMVIDVNDDHTVNIILANVTQGDHGFLMYATPSAEVTAYLDVNVSLSMEVDAGEVLDNAGIGVEDLLFQWGGPHADYSSVDGSIMVEGEFLIEEVEVSVEMNRDGSLVNGRDEVEGQIHAVVDSMLAHGVNIDSLDWEWDETAQAEYNADAFTAV